jgi:cytochrome c553
MLLSKPGPRNARLARLAAALTLAAAANGFAASPLALSCLGCHQPSVNAPEMPALNALSHRRLAQALRSARDAPRLGSIMARFASKLSDAEIDRLAAELTSIRP